MKASWLAGCGAALLLLGGVAGGAEPKREERPRVPSPSVEALEACTGKVEGDACTFEEQGERKSGHCLAGPDDHVACRPSR